nr:MAG TPA: hypothetical protein [Caudoviricetes sp.]
MRNKIEKHTVAKRYCVLYIYFILHCQSHFFTVIYYQYRRAIKVLLYPCFQIISGNINIENV